MMFLLAITQEQGPKLLDYAKDPAKSEIGPMDINQQETNKANYYYWKTFWWAPCRCPGQKLSSHS